MPDLVSDPEPNPKGSFRVQMRPVKTGSVVSGRFGSVGRIWIREAQKHADPDPDPQHWFYLFSLNQLAHFLDYMPVLLYLTIDLPALARGNVNLREDGAQVEVHQRRRRTGLAVVDAVAAAPPTPTTARLAG